jgi:LAGLIDADG DNA endonuclease family
LRELDIIDLLGSYSLFDVELLQHSMFISPILYAGKKGSKYSKARATSPDKLAVSLTQVQKDVLVGTILGDASIERNKPTHNTRIRFEQTFPAHAYYLTTLYIHFLNLTGKCPTVQSRKADKRTGDIYSTISFKTLMFPCLNIFHAIFYKDGTKIVPLNIGELLSARALAYWIMDDGGKGSHGETILHTRSFTLKEVQLLQSVLMDNFGLRTRLSEKVPGQWVIIIPVKQVRPVKDIVAPYMCLSMLYKL